MMRIGTLALVGAAAVPAATSGQAQTARINVDLTWEGPAPRIILQAPDGGSREISNSSQPVRIDQAGQRWARYRLIVRYPGVESEFAILARTNEPPYGLRLHSPADQNCDTRVVTPIVQQAHSSNLDALANAALAANYLRKRQTNRCGDVDENRLRAALLEAHCRLATNTTFFSVPDMEWGSEPRVQQCRAEALNRGGRVSYQLAAASARSGDIAAMDVALADLRALREDPEGRAAFASIGEENLRRVEIDGLFNTTVALRNAGDTRGEALAARLTALSGQSEYRITFRDAGLRPVAARDLERQLRSLASTTSAVEGP
jgi:hypothetical protein